MKSAKLLFLALAVLLGAGAVHAQVAFRGAASAGIASTGDITYGGRGATAVRTTCGSINPALPAGTTAGDFLLAMVVVREESATVTMPGWNTLMAQSPVGLTNFQVFLYWRIATGGDPNTITESGTCQSLFARISRFTGVDTTDPILNATAATQIPAANWTYRIADYIRTGTETTTVPNMMLLVAAFTRDDSITAAPRAACAGATAFTTLTQAFVSAQTTGRDSSLWLFYGLQAAAGLKGPYCEGKTVGSDANHGVVFALRPTGLRINVPAGTVAGDVMVASIAVQPSTIVITAPAGWTLVRNNTQAAGSSSRMATYYRVATAGEPASYLWTFSGAASTGATGGIISFSGVDTSSVLDVEGGNTTASSLTHIANAISTTVANTMLVGSFEFTSTPSAANWSSNMTADPVDQGSIAGPSNAGIRLLMAYEARAATGSTGTRTATASGVTADTGLAYLLALRPAVTVNHYAISVLSTSVANCDYAEVTITAHNAAHAAVNPPSSRTVTLSLSAGAATAAWLPTLVVGTGGWTPAGATATYLWPGNESAFTVRLRQSAVISLTVNANDTFVTEALAEDPTISFVNSAFRVSNGANAALSIGTQISGKPSNTGTGTQSLFLQAIRTDTVTGACTSIFPGGSEVDVDVGAQCNNPAACTRNVTLTTTSGTGSPSGSFVPAGAGTYPATIRFRFTTANGEAPFFFSYADAGQITLQFRHVTAAPAVTIVGTSNAFVTRPFGFAFRGANDATPIQHGTLPSSALLVPAGDPFTMTVTAYQWVTGEDANNDGVPDAGVNITDNGTVPNFAGTVTVASSANLPGVATGAISRGAACLLPATTALSGGTATDATWCYSEAGNVFLTATMNDYLGAADADITGNSGLDGTGAAGGYVGRFTPKRFRLIGAPAFTPRYIAACAPASTFAYMGEGIRLDAFRMEAINTLGNRTVNYDAAYARHDPVTGTAKAAFAIAARSGTTDYTARVSATHLAVPAWSQGLLQAGGNPLQIGLSLDRNATNTPDGPLPATGFGIAPVDLDGVSLPAYDLDVNNDATNDHLLVGTTELRFGRLSLQNAFGSGATLLPVPIELQYWNGSSFARNNADSCTTLARSEIALDFTPVSNLTACETALNAATVPFASGLGTLLLSSPGTGNNGSVLLTANLDSAAGSYCNPASYVAATNANKAYLLGRWDGGTAYDDKPGARAAFGLYGSQPKNFIFFRENY